MKANVIVVRAMNVYDQPIPNARYIGNVLIGIIAENTQFITVIIAKAEPVHPGTASIMKRFAPNYI
jgi:hypothetical protein